MAAFTLQGQHGAGGCHRGRLPAKLKMFTIRPFPEHVCLLWGFWLLPSALSLSLSLHFNGDIQNMKFNIVTMLSGQFPGIQDFHGAVRPSLLPVLLSVEGCCEGPAGGLRAPS